MLGAMRRPKSPELQLLLACARAHVAEGDEAAIHALLKDGVDWTVFVGKTMAHGLAGLAGHTLARLAPDAVPGDIQVAFAAFVDRTRKSNQGLLDELARLLGLLAAKGVETIPFKGPVLTMQAFGDLGLRGFRDLDFLIHDRDVEKTVTLLQDQGYERPGELTQAQFEQIHRLQGQEIMFKRETAAVEPHTKLTSLKMALDIDYDGLWQRSASENIFGHRMRTFAPEDTLLVLAIHGGKELWWDIKWACDIADFIAGHPQLDWKTIATRAHAQGCTRMLLVATSLARHYLGARVPDFIAAAETADPVVDQITGRILARWEMDDPGGPPSNTTLSMDRLRLHDGIARQTSYVMRTLILPGPQHIPLVALPRALAFGYIPIGIVHDRIALPLYRGYEWLQAQAQAVRKSASLSPLALALTPMPAQARERLRHLQRRYKTTRRQLALDPADSNNWAAMGDILTSMGHDKDAVAAYDKALTIVPDRKAVWQKRSKPISALRKAGTWQGADNAPAFNTEDANGWALYAGFLSTSGRHVEAARAAASALQLDPGHEAANRIGINSRLVTCDWTRRAEDQRFVRQALASGSAILSPFNLKMLSDSEEDSLACARLWTNGLTGQATPHWAGPRYRHDNIRIAYLSTDFRAHPVGTTIIAPLEHHDRGRFEVTAVSLISKPDCPVQQRIKAAVDRFIDISAMDDEAVVVMLRDLEIDIAIDLNGLTGARRSRILMRRPAPLQVNYLGYPGTSAMPFIDYIIADKSVIPEESRALYSEKVAYLPGSYLPYDEKRAIAEAPSSRSEEGLPETGFIFASFNRLSKVGPEIFAVWMRLLQAVEGSVLWIPRDDPAVMANLRREAATQGVAPERIIFAVFKERIEDHLARLRLADLFLDTLPYNAHSTASDALWAGLPVLTCPGRAFQARVAAGLLYAIGLPELVTDSLAEYEACALALARNPAGLAALRSKLARNRSAMPLFDTAGFTRGLEAIYRTMWERQQAGLAPESFSIADER